MGTGTETRYTYEPDVVYAPGQGIRRRRSEGGNTTS